MPAGTLYLLPTALGGDNALAVLPACTLEVLARVRHFIVENPRSARAFLKAVRFPASLREAHISTLDEHTQAPEVPVLLEPLLAGLDCALLSEAGCPAVADPGAALVRLAHEYGIRVKPLVGPSALLLALMSVIGRTAAIGRTREELEWDLSYLVQLWHAIEQAAHQQTGAFLIYQESSLVIRAIRDYFHQDIGEILIDTEAIYEQAQQFMPSNSSKRSGRLSSAEGSRKP